MAMINNFDVHLFSNIYPMWKRRELAMFLWIRESCLWCFCCLCSWRKSRSLHLSELPVWYFRAHCFWVI